MYPSRRAPSRPIVSRSSSCPPPHRVAAHNVSNSNNRAKVRTKIGEYDYDAFTMQGIKLFSPCTGNWHEVSVMGRMVSIYFPNVKLSPPTHGFFTITVHFARGRK
jgi:hypothetical protein